MERIRDLGTRGLVLARRRWVWVAAAALLIALTLMSSWFLRLATAPARMAGEDLALAPYGLPGVTIKVIHPTRLGIDQDAAHPGQITVLARANTEADIRAFDLVLPLSSEALAFVDREGRRVPGRLWIVPGYPDALPYELGVAHGQTQLQGRQFVPHTVSVTPVIRHDGATWPVPELAFDIRLESRWERAYRWLGEAFSSVILPYLLVVVLAFAGLWLWQRYQRRQRLKLERDLADAYVRLREQIKLDHWEAARQEIETIRLHDVRYRDVQSLDTMISAAETADWRRDQLYGIGIQAYKRRDWPAAVQAFRAIEQETPYYRDIRFLRRTSALYADLLSRDRSLRLAAAQALGQVADLVDMTPLLYALGDASDTVSDAAQSSFREIGAAAYDTLLGGLNHDNPEVRSRAFVLLSEAGQTARANLLAGLRSTEPRVTEQVAQLLSRLGARRELASALLWASSAHLAGIVAALSGEGGAATGTLLSVLCKAPPERQQVVLGALAAIKVEHDITRRIEEAVRATKDPEQRRLLQKALDAPAAPFFVDSGDNPRTVSVSSQADQPAPPEPEQAAELPHLRRLRLLDRRRS